MDPKEILMTIIKNACSECNSLVFEGDIIKTEFYDLDPQIQIIFDLTKQVSIGAFNEQNKVFTDLDDFIEEIKKRE